MKYFIIDNTKGKTLHIDCARCIYRNLNQREQDEISSFCDDFPSVNLSNAIQILYLTLSQRRRMNQRLVKGVKEYKKDHKCSLNIVSVPDNVIGLNVTINKDGTEKLSKYTNTNVNADYEPIELWLNQVSVAEEIARENELNIPKEIEIDNFRKSMVTKFKFKTIKNKIRRWFYGLTHKKQKMMEKTMRKNKRR